MTKHNPNRRDEVKQFVVEFTREHGFGPTVREITKAVGLSSPSSTLHHLDVLEQSGDIKRTRNRARTVVAMEEG